MNQIMMTTFTDPMMGLSYECEPVYEQLTSHYQGQIVFKYVMSGLVRDVSDFMLPEELSLPPEDGMPPQSKMLPSREMVTTCQGMNLPLACSAFCAARCNPPQQGTSMRTMVTLLMSLSRMMAVSFSV